MVAGVPSTSWRTRAGVSLGHRVTSGGFRGSQQVDVRLPSPSTGGWSSAVPPGHGPGAEKLRQPLGGDAQGLVLPREPQLSPPTLPGALRCKSWEHHWRNATRLEGLHVGVSCWSEPIPAALLGKT